MWSFSIITLVSIIFDYTFSSETGQKQIVVPSARPSYPFYVSASVPALHDDMYKQIFQLILDQGLFFNNASMRTRPPFQFRSPAELGKLFDFSLPELRVSHGELLELVEKLLKYSPHAAHPFKVDRHGSGLDPQGLVGEWMGTVLTTSMTTYKDSPVFTLMEDTLMEKTRQLIGYPEGRGGGVVVPGSGVGNAYAIQAALQSKFPGWKKKGAVGTGAPNVTIFLSEDASFAHEKYCIWEGVGINACVRVPVDANGKMSIAELMKQIAVSKSRGRMPLMIIATAGTAVIGAIDPLEEISSVAHNNNMWFHIDGQLAGSFFLSNILKDRLIGLSSADSFLWAPGKDLGMPTVGAVLVSKEIGIFSKMFSSGANILYGKSSLYNSSLWDNGDATMQTTRRPNVASIWFSFKSQGQEGLAKRLEHAQHLKVLAMQVLQSRMEQFVSVLPEFESSQIAFYYVPSRLRSLSKADREILLSKLQFTEKLKVKLLRDGALSISVDTWHHQRNPFFVMSLRNCILSEADIKYMFDLIEYFGEEIFLLLSGNQSEDVIPGSSNSLQVAAENSLPLSPVKLRPEVPPPVEPYSDYVNAPVESGHRNYFQDFFNEFLKNGIYYEDKRSEAPMNFQTPEKLLSLVDFSLGNSTENLPESNFRIYNNLLRYNIHNAHPYYDDHLAVALDPYSQMADFVISTLNSPMITYKDNPILTLMEREVIKSVMKLIGYPSDGEDGLILPGGSAGDQVAMLLAIQQRDSRFKTGGLAEINKTMVVYLSREAHYATIKGAFFMGIGTENSILVETDDRGRMDPKDLEQKILRDISQGRIPFMVVATAGTTVLGAFDPINDIADISHKYNLWLHVDAAYGGSTIFSNDPQRVHSRLQGIEKSDSFTVNAHKALTAIREITCFVTRHSKILRQVAPAPSSQEFNNQHLYDGYKYDGGITQLFPDHRGNVFKLWFMWKAKGRQGLGQHIDYGYDLTAQAYRLLLSKNETFILFNPDQVQVASHINFYYVPKRLRATAFTKSTMQELSQIQGAIHDRLLSENVLFLFMEGFPKMPNTLILSLYNSALTIDDVAFMLSLIEYHGERLY